LNITLLGDRGLFYGDHLPLHLGEFGSGLLITTDEEGGRPEYDDSRRGSPPVFGSLTILNT
jgi:hypothetical protein